VNAERRVIGRVPLLVRGVIVLAAETAVVATTLPSWDAPDGYVLVALVAALGCVIAPDSAFALVFSATVAACWAARGPDRVDAAVVVTALALLGVHVSCALAAAVPVSAVVHADVVRRWLRPTFTLAAAVLAAAGVTAMLEAWSPAGSIVVTLTGLGLLTALVWWAGEPRPEDGTRSERRR
jgi:hypothetical protein